MREKRINITLDLDRMEDLEAYKWYLQQPPQQKSRAVVNSILAYKSGESNPDDVKRLLQENNELLKKIMESGVKFQSGIYTTGSDSDSEMKESDSMDNPEKEDDIPDELINILDSW